MKNPIMIVLMLILIIAVIHAFWANGDFITAILIVIVLIALVIKRRD